MKTTGALSAWNALMWASVAVLVSALAFHQFYPKPSPKTSPAKRLQQEAQANRDTRKLLQEAAESEVLAAKFFWPGDAKRAEAEAMALVTKLANDHEVSLGAFRPQKSAEDSGLRRLPFSLNLEGAYPDVAKFLRDLETPGNRLAVRMVQLSASDGISNHVSVTMAVVAFQKVESKKPAAKDSKVKESGSVQAQPIPAGGTAGGPKTDVQAAPVGTAADEPPKNVESNQEKLNNPALKPSEHS